MIIIIFLRKIPQDLCSRLSKLQDMDKCFHCGNSIEQQQRVLFDNQLFCCNGCKTVYEIFSANDLKNYYDFEQHPGSSPDFNTEKFDFLDIPEIADKLLDFAEGNIQRIRLYIPQIHCSSCIWILENLNKLKTGILSSQVNFSQKKVSVVFQPDDITLKELVLLLASIGYEPYISLEHFDEKPKYIDRSLIYKIGIAFFGFGNIMLLSFPEYFNVNDYWMREYKDFFRYLIVLLSLPVFLYSATPYYKSAWHSIKNKSYNIDIPMALGIIVMFVRSMVDIFFQDGQGYLDSMCGLVFFMLSGKLIQQTTFNFLSFERDYKSYFPIAVTKIHDNKEQPLQVYDIVQGDRLLIRNQELVPVDAVLLSEKAYIDYSFVTGEAVPVEKKSGDKIYAGGKQVGNAVYIEAVNTVSQSYLTQLWSNEVFQKKVGQTYKTITDRASRIFTPVLLTLAITGFIGWSWYSFTAAFNVFTAVLIVACPCALALTAPYTWGNVIRIMGRKKLYLKNTVVIEQLAKADTLVFDKTGTITSGEEQAITYRGKELSAAVLADLRNVVRGSNHPLSRRLYRFLPEAAIASPSEFHEIPGKGIIARVGTAIYKVGSREWIQTDDVFSDNLTRVFISVNELYLGYFIIENQYREGLSELFHKLQQNGYHLYVLSGDNEGEKHQLERLLPKGTSLIFNKKPDEKLEFIRQLQQQGKNVMMIGDGLNDAGALAQSNVGVSISENVNVFTPASDAILDASRFKNIPYFLKYAQNAMKTIKMSYGLALTYNVVGISFALSHKLSPLVAAVIMPLSTATIIGFVTFMTHYFAGKKS